MGVKIYTYIRNSKSFVQNISKNFYFHSPLDIRKIYVYICNTMKADDAILVKLPKELKERVRQYVFDNRVKGGASGMVRRFLEKKTAPKA